MDECQQAFLMSSYTLATEATVKIEFLKDYVDQQVKADYDHDPKLWWEVYDRTAVSYTHLDVYKRQILKVFPRRISTLAGCTCSLSNGVIDKVPASSILNSVLSDKIIVSPSHIKRYYILSHNPCAGNINLPIIILRLP